MGMHQGISHDSRECRQDLTCVQLYESVSDTCFGQMKTGARLNAVVMCACGKSLDSGVVRCLHQPAIVGMLRCTYVIIERLMLYTLIAEPISYPGQSQRPSLLWFPVASP